MPCARRSPPIVTMQQVGPVARKRVDIFPDVLMGPRLSVTFL
ncbi:MAG: hypothetical protein ABL956_02305 [Hyphomonadaceae bacterium]